MHKIQLPPDVSVQIGQGGYPVELCDERGVKAVAVPPGLFREMFETWTNHVFGLPGKTKAAVDPGGMTTAEVIEHLRALEAKHRGAA